MQPAYHSEKSFLKSSTLLTIAFAAAFFPRLLDSIGAPATINFVHFAIVPLACGIALLKSRTKNLTQLAIFKDLLFALVIFFAIELASAILNDAGIVNAILSSLLWTEPFLLLLAISSIAMSPISINRFRFWLVGFNLFHLSLAFIQRFVLHLDRAAGFGDNIQGVFYRSGSGHVVASSVSLTFCIYFFISAKHRPIWIRIAVLAAGIVHLIVADAKQVLLTFIIGFAILALTKIGDPVKVFTYFISGALFLFVFIWAIQNIEALKAFNTWLRPEIYGPNGEATLLKISSAQIILSHHHSDLNWLLGVGPGHTVDRLGGWMLKDYSSLLSPLGATTTTIGDETWARVAASWLGDQSSFFAPFYGWIALWGDLGFLGLGSYLYLWFIVWTRLCPDDFSKIVILTSFTHGLIFTQLQEPGYMLFVAYLIGLRWHEHHSRQKNLVSQQFVLLLPSQNVN